MLYDVHQYVVILSEEPILCEVQNNGIYYRHFKQNPSLHEYL